MIPKQSVYYLVVKLEPIFESQYLINNCLANNILLFK